jgi:hypothetical protein
MYLRPEREQYIISSVVEIESDIENDTIMSDEPGAVPVRRSNNNYRPSGRKKAAAASAAGNNDGTAQQQKPASAFPRSDFPYLLHNFLTACSKSHPTVVEWSKDGTAFCIHPNRRTLSKLLAKHFHGGK